MHFLLVGCGKMGCALMRGWGRHASASGIVVVDPFEPPCDIQEITGVSWLPAHDDLLPGYHPDAIILAVKSQEMANVLPPYAPFADSVFLSIAAGQTLHHLGELLGNHQHPIVRAMPNLPASIGKGISVAVANAHVSESQRKLCDSLLSALGEVIWIENEALLDAVTALSGCGPAYIFALVEAMEKAGEQLGLPPHLARTLARQTAVGSGALLDQGISTPEALRRAVTSPGGSTEAAMKHLIAENGLSDIIMRAMHAAAGRSKELQS